MRFIIAVLCAHAVMAVLATLLWSFALADVMAPLTALFRAPEQVQLTAPWAFAAQGLRTVIFAALIVMLRGPGRVSLGVGALYGALMGAFAGTYHAANSTALPLPLETALAWIAFDTILLTVGGAVFALTYRPRAHQG